MLETEASGQGIPVVGVDRQEALCTSKRRMARMQLDCGIGAEDGFVVFPITGSRQWGCFDCSGFGERSFG